MERLTEWDEFGNADIIALSDVMSEIYAELSFSETNALTDALSRLAAYEYTGLWPEEVSEYKHLCDSYVEDGLDSKFVQFCIDATQNGLSIDRICELAQAEKDGRMVVLPCKVGQMVWAESPVRGRAYSFRAPDVAWIVENADRFGREIFLAREEAEAALKKREEADNEAD